MTDSKIVENIKKEIENDTEIGRLVWAKIKSSAANNGVESFDSYIGKELEEIMDLLSAKQHFRRIADDQLFGEAVILSNRDVKYVITKLKSEIKSAASHLSNVMYTDSILGVDITQLSVKYAQLRKDLDKLTQ